MQPSTHLRLSLKSANNPQACFCLALALFTLMPRFIPAAPHNVLVTHYGIRKLFSNTPRIRFPSLDIPLGRVLLWQSPSARLSRHSEELMRRRGERGGAQLRSSHAESDSHYQLRLFLFLFTATINHTVTGSQGERETEGENTRRR